MTGSDHVTSTHPNAADEPSERGFYLYGIGRSSHQFGVEEVPGTQVRVSSVVNGELAGIVQEVPLEDYSEDTLQSRLQDYDMLIETAQAHQYVVAHVHAMTPILPAKFGTIYPSERAVQDALSGAYDRVLARLEAVEGCDEWAMHLLGHADSMRENALAKDQELNRLRNELKGASPGRAYLLRQRMKDRIDFAVEELQRRVMQDAFREIRSLVRDFQSDPPNQGLWTESGESEVARASLLIHRDQVDAFFTTVERLSAKTDGIRIEVTGPWPPYSFTQIEDEA